MKICGGWIKRKFRQWWSGNHEWQAGFPEPTTVGRTLVQGATHRSGHTLDLIFTRKESTVIFDCERICGITSDHHALKRHLKLQCPSAVRMTLRYRKLFGSFMADIESSLRSSKPTSDLNKLTHNFDSTLQEHLDNHAPMVTRTITIRPNCPWYSESFAF